MLGACSYLVSIDFFFFFLRENRKISASGKDKNFPGGCTIGLLQWLDTAMEPSEGPVWGLAGNVKKTGD